MTRADVCQWVSLATLFIFALSIQVASNTLGHAALALGLGSLLGRHDVAGLVGLLSGTAQGLTLVMAPLVGWQCDSRSPAWQFCAVLVALFAQSTLISLMGFALTAFRSTATFTCAFVMQSMMGGALAVMLNSLAYRAIESTIYGRAAALRGCFQSLGSLLGYQLLVLAPLPSLPHNSTDADSVDSTSGGEFFILCALVVCIVPLVSLTSLHRHLRERGISVRQRTYPGDSASTQPLFGSIHVASLGATLNKRNVLLLLLSRSLYEMALAVTTLYIYLLVDLWGCESSDATQWLASAATADTVAVLLTSVPSGEFGDWKGGRKLLIYVSSAMYILVFLFMPWGSVHAFAWFLTLSAVFGVAHGIQKAADYALMMDVVPTYSESGTVIGMWQAAGMLGGIGGTLLFGPCLELFRVKSTRAERYTRGGYAFAFVLAALLMIASAVCVRAIRVRQRRQTGSSPAQSPHTTRYIITGGYFDGTADGFLCEIELCRNSSGIPTVLRVVEPMQRVMPPDGAPPVVNKGLAGACWHRDELLACMPNCVMAFKRTGRGAWECSRVIHDARFNDLHHPCSLSCGGFAVANTGLETIDLFDDSGSRTGRVHIGHGTEEALAAADLAERDGLDFRAVSTRNKHKHHVNHCWDCGDGRLVATLLKSRETVIVQQNPDVTRASCLRRARFPAPPHEGFVLQQSLMYDGAVLWNTTIDGHVYAHDFETGTILRSWALGDDPADGTGWTRGLCVLEDGLLIGTTVIREHNEQFLESEGTQLSWPWPAAQTCTAVTFVPFDVAGVVGSLCALLPDQHRRPKVFSILPAGCGEEAL